MERGGFYSNLISSYYVRVIDKTLEEMRALDIAYKYFIFDENNNTVYPERGKNNTVMTLEEFFENFPNHNINLEIKDNNQMASYLLLKIMEQFPGIENRVVVASKYCDNIEVLRKYQKLNVCTAACEREVVSYVVLSALKSYIFWHSFIQDHPSQVILSFDSSLFLRFFKFQRDQEE